MTSADDFHLISWRNFFGLAAVVVGVMIPVGLRYWFRREVDSVVEDEMEGELSQDEADEGRDRILAVGPVKVARKTRTLQERFRDDDDDESLRSSEDDDDGDVILEAGPTIFDIDKDGPIASSSSSSR